MSFIPLKKTFFLVFLVLAACTGKQDASQRIRMRLPTEPPTIDWALATDNVSKEVIINIQSGLLTHNELAEVMPDLASDYKVSEDGKTYTFNLRTDAKWSDGVSLTAQHFVDAWERVLNPATASEYAYFLFNVAGAEDYQSGKISDFAQVGAKATNDHTFVVTLKAPAAYWKHIPTFWITYPIRKDVVAKHGEKWTDPQNIVSIGPYLLKEWQRDSKIVLVSNPNSIYAADAKIPEIEFRIVKDDSVAISLFETGDLDIVRNLPPTQLRHLAQSPEFRASEYLRVTYFGFNIKDPSVNKAEVRKALALAIDKTEIEKLLFPLAKPTDSWTPASLTSEATETAGLKHNLEEAKKIWAGIKDAPKTIELWFDQNETYKIVAENLQNQWKRAFDIDVKLSSQEWKVYLKQMATKSPAIWRLGWGADYPDPDTFMALFTCNSGNNHTGFCNPKFDANVNKASQIFDAKERAQLYVEAQKIFLEEEVALLPLFQEQSLHMVSQRVTGFKPNLIGDFYFRKLGLK